MTRFLHQRRWELSDKESKIERIGKTPKMLIKKSSDVILKAACVALKYQYISSNINAAVT